jgi:hypothetical protein
MTAIQKSKSGNKRIRINSTPERRKLMKTQEKVARIYSGVS